MAKAAAREECRGTCPRRQRRPQPKSPGPTDEAAEARERRCPARDGPQAHLPCRPPCSLASGASPNGACFCNQALVLATKPAGGICGAGRPSCLPRTASRLLCELRFVPVLHPRRILSSEDFSSQRSRSSKEATEADAFLCDLDPRLCALCVSTPLLWLRLRHTRASVARSVCGIQAESSLRECTRARIKPPPGLFPLGGCR